MESSRAQGKRSLINYKTEEDDDDDEEEEEEEEEDQEEEEEEDSNRSSSSLVYGEDERRKRVMMMTSNSTSNPSKRGSGAGGSTARPSCQADNCNADLSDAKQYYRRHKVCDFHAKAPSVFVAGLQQRFCQQCSRFHSPSEFDDNKRSCRRRLAGHNERRRKASSEYQSPTD